MHPLLQATIFQTGAGSPPFKIKEQRIYVVFGRETTRLDVRTQKVFVVFGRETTRLNVRSQRLYAVMDFSAETDFRYWRLYCYREINHTYFRWPKLEMRESLGGADVATVGNTIYGPEGVAGTGTNASSNLFDGSDSTEARMLTETEGCWIGQDFGSGTEKQIVEIVIKAGSTTYVDTPTFWELQASNDLHDWRTILRDIGLEYTASEERTFN